MFHREIDDYVYENVLRKLNFLKIQYQNDTKWKQSDEYDKLIQDKVFWDQVRQMKGNLSDYQVMRLNEAMVPLLGFGIQDIIVEEKAIEEIELNKAESLIKKLRKIKNIKLRYQDENKWIQSIDYQQLQNDKELWEQLKSIKNELKQSEQQVISELLKEVVGFTYNEFVQEEEQQEANSLNFIDYNGYQDMEIELEGHIAQNLQPYGIMQEERKESYFITQLKNDVNWMLKNLLNEIEISSRLRYIVRNISLVTEEEIRWLTAISQAFVNYIPKLSEIIYNINKLRLKSQNKQEKFQQADQNNLQGLASLARDALVQLREMLQQQEQIITKPDWQKAIVAFYELFDKYKYDQLEQMMLKDQQLMHSDEASQVENVVARACYNILLSYIPQFNEMFGEFKLRIKPILENFYPSYQIFQGSQWDLLKSFIEFLYEDDTLFDTIEYEENYAQAMLNVLELTPINDLNIYGTIVSLFDAVKRIKNKADNDAHLDLDTALVELQLFIKGKLEEVQQQLKKIKKYDNFKRKYQYLMKLLSKLNSSWAQKIESAQDKEKIQQKQKLKIDQERQWIQRFEQKMLQKNIDPIKIMEYKFRADSVGHNPVIFKNMMYNVFTTDWRILPFLLFIYNIEDYLVDVRYGFSRAELRMYENTNHIVAENTKKRLQDYFNQYGDEFRDLFEDQKVVLEAIVRNCDNIPLWVHEYINQQLSLYGYLKWDRTPDYVNIYEANQSGRAENSAVQWQRRAGDFLDPYGNRLQGSYIEMFRRVTFETARFPVEQNKRHNTESCTTVGAYIASCIDKFLKDSKIPAGRRRIFLNVEFLVERQQFRPMRVIDEYIVDNWSRVLRILKGFEITRDIDGGVYTKNIANFDITLSNIMYKMIDKWRDLYGDYFNWVLESIHISQFRVLIFPQLNYQLRRGPNMTQQQYNQQQVDAAYEIFQRKIGCSKFDKTLNDILLHTELMEGGLCLYEAWYWCYFEEKRKVKSKMGKVELLDYFQKLDRDQQHIFIQGKYEKLIEYLPTRIGVYIYYDGTMVHPDEIENENVTSCIVIKDGHAYGCQWSDEIKRKLLQRSLIMKSNKKQIAERFGQTIRIEPKKQKVDRRITIDKSVKVVRGKSYLLNWYLDIETFNSGGGIQQVYLICLVNDLDEKYSFRGLQCVEDFNFFIKERMLFKKNSDGIQKIPTIKHIIWSFNGCKFDYLYLFGLFIKQYKCNILGSHNNLKSISFCNLKFLDFRNIYNTGSLKQIAKSWKVDAQKTEFDYDKVNLDTMWIHMDESETYCINDCRVLQQIILRFRHEMQEYGKYDFISAPNMSLYIWQTKYLKEGQYLQGISRDFYPQFKIGYRGGFTCQFRTKMNVEKLYYYDFNNMYGWALTQPLPYDLDFQQEYCHHVTKENYLDLICPESYYQLSQFCYEDDTFVPGFGIRTKDGLIYPLKYNSTYYVWGIEVISGFECQILKHVQTEIRWKWKFDIIAKDYVIDMKRQRDKYKAEGNTPQEQIKKLLINSLYGSWAQKEHGVVEYMSLDSFQERFANGGFDDQIQDIKLLPDGIVVVKYFIQKLKEKCFLKGTASYVTALSRKKLYKSMYDCEWEIWYSDTDSFITSKKLPTSNELGDIKLEYTLKDCLFVSPKVYWLETEEGDQVAHMKGVNRKVFLDENTGKVRGDCKQIFEELLQNKQSTFTNTNVFHRQVGYVKVNKTEEKIITVKESAKRIKIDDYNSRPFEYILDQQ